MDPGAPMEKTEVKVLGDGVWARQAIDNMTWFDMGDHLIVIDALEESHLEDEVLDVLRNTTGGKPVRYVLNTHPHYDHVALNRVYERRFNAEIINMQTADIPPEGRWFEGESRRVLMLPKTGCHTDMDCIVWSPEDSVLCTGDIFGWGLIPLTVNLRLDAARLLLATYAELIAYDARVVVPGHGPLCTTRELEQWCVYFRWMRGEVAVAIDAGHSDEEILADLGPPEDMHYWWRLLQWKHADALGKMIKAVRRGWLDALD
jgi:cyclase